MRTGIFLVLAFLLLPNPVGASSPSHERNDSALSMKELDPDVLTDSRLDDAIGRAEAYPLGSKENPVRADGPPGQRAYIARLRCADGSRPQVGTRFNVGPGPYGTIVDVYPLQCGQAVPGVPLHMDMYFRHIEDRAPPGFSIESSIPTA